MLFTFDQGQFSITLPNPARGTTEAVPTLVKYTIHATDLPVGIDMITMNDGKEVKTLAIYTIDGDSLTISQAVGKLQTKQRPKAFTESGVTTLVLERLRN